MREQDLLDKLPTIEKINYRQVKEESMGPVNEVYEASSFMLNIGIFCLLILPITLYLGFYTYTFALFRIIIIMTGGYFMLLILGIILGVLVKRKLYKEALKYYKLEEKLCPKKK